MIWYVRNKNQYIQFAKLIFETDGVQLPDFQSNNDYNSLERQASQDYFDTLFDADKREFLLSELLGKIGDPDITANQILDKGIEIEHPSVLQKLQSAIYNFGQNAKLATYFEQVDINIFLIF